MPERIKVNQFDHDKNALEFTIYNGASLFVAPSGATVMIEGHKADGTGFQYEAVIEGSVVIADLEEQMTVVAGETVTELVIRDSAGNRIGTANFILDVEPAALGDDTVISETDLPMIQKAANNVDLIMEKSAQVQADAAQVASDKAAAQTARTGAETARTGAETAQAAAETAQEAAKAAQTAAETAKTAAQTAQGLAETARTGAETAQAAAETAQDNAEGFAEDAEAWATGKRGGVAVPATDETYHNNSEYYAGLAHDAADEAQRIVDDLGYPINPKGSITFANLPTSGMEYGWMYNVTDDFTTDSRFVEGSGIRYNGGAEVYWTSQDKWSVMAGAGVTGVKGAAESTYRKGQINITPENIGLGNVNNTSDADKPISTAQQAGLDEKVNWSEQNILGAKNLIPYPYAETTKTLGGITFTDNGDGTITANGTATSTVYFLLLLATQEPIPIKSGKYILSGTEADKGDVRLYLRYQGDTVWTMTHLGVETELILDNDTVITSIGLQILANNVITDQVIKPMLRLASIADDTYAPYAKTNKQLTDDITSHAELISENAVNIESNADAIADIVNVYGSKNLLPYPYYYTTITTNGITFTDNGDGSVTVNGTNTSSSAIHFGFYNTLGTNWIIEPNTEYIVSFELKNANNLSFYVNVNNTDISAIRNKSTGYYEAKFKTPSAYTTRFTIAMYIQASSTETNAIVYPMLRLASIKDETYVPYVQTNKQLMEHTNEALERIGKAGKNLIPYPYYSPSGKVNRGVTFTYDSDGVVTCNGTSTNEQAYIILNRHIKLEQGVKYILSAEHEEGCFAILYFKNSDYTDNRVDVNIVYENGVVRNATNANYASLLYSGTYHNSAEITVSATTYADIQARVNNNVTVENAIIKPMLRLASITDDTWEPYSPTLEEANKQKISWTAAEKSVKKNLLVYPYENTTKTVNGITFTDNGDGTVSVSGTKTSSNDAVFYFDSVAASDIVNIVNRPYAGGKKYIISSGGYYDQQTFMWIRFYPTEDRSVGNSILVQLKTSDKAIVDLSAYPNIYGFRGGITVYGADTSVPNVTFKPMIRDASIQDDTWASYIKDNAELMEADEELKELDEKRVTWKANRILGAKNLIPYPYSDATITKNGMAFTDNGDGSVTVNGTATASTSYYFTPIDWYQDIIGRFILSSGGTELTNSFKMTIESPAGTNYNLENSGELTVNLTATTRNIRLFITSGTTVNNVTVYPMLRLAEDTDKAYQPYAMTNSELTESLTLFGTCETAADQQVKVVNVVGRFKLRAGATIGVRFSVNNTFSVTAENTIKLNVGGTGEYEIRANDSAIVTGTNTTYYGRAKYVNSYMFDGTYWIWQSSSADNNTTYNAMSIAELVAGTATAGRTQRADYLKKGILALSTQYGTCDTAAATAAKVVVTSNTNFVLFPGAQVMVKFTNTNTAQNPTLNVNNTGAKPIIYAGTVITTSNLAWAGTANRYMRYIYNGGSWIFSGWDSDDNTTYTNMTETEAVAGTSTTARSISAAVMKKAIEAHGGSGGGTSTTLWENSDPSVNFTSQTVNIGDVSEYSAIAVDWYDASGSAYKTSLFEPGRSFAIREVLPGVSGSIPFMIYRSFSWSTANLTFLISSCDRKAMNATTSNTNNAYLIPYRIRGIK